MQASKKSKVHFFSNDVHPNLRKVGKLKNFIESIFIKEKKTLGSLNYIFCSDKYLLEINQKYLDHDFYTDVVTFDLSPTKNELVGESYISLDRVKENARNSRSSINSELHRVVFHAALHLCGYNDKTTRQVTRIRKKEDSLLHSYFKK